MRKVSLEDIEPGTVATDADRRGLTAPLGTTDVALNQYRLAPGERFSGGLHAHFDQEELFVVIEGEATFETLDGETVVGTGKAIRFAPGEFQSGKNDSGKELVAFALGAPCDTNDVRVPIPCPECGHENSCPMIDESVGGTVLICPDCGATTEVECSNCESDRKRAVLDDDGETVLDICLDCGTETTV